MTRLKLPFAAAGLLMGTALACGWFDQDPLTELAESMIDGPVTLLARADAAAAPDMPPLQPGELQPLESTGDGLHVLALAPQGTERQPSQVAVIFDRPMVSLTELAESGPIDCAPRIDGRMRWAGTSTAVIVPTGGAFPAATAYRCKVPAGTASADGTALNTAVEWSFSTVAPALERSWPSDGEDAWDESKPLILRFNQAVSPADVQRSLAFTVTSTGKKVAFTVAAATGERAKADTVEISAKLQRDTEYSLVIPAGFTGDEGPLPSSTATTLGFRTTPKAAIVETRPTGQPVDPDSNLVIVFSTEVDGKALADKVHISPPPPDGWKPAEMWTSRYWYYNPRLSPRTTYTVTVDPGVKDVHGQVVESGTSWSFTTGDLEPLLDTPWSTSDLYPSVNPPSLPIRFRNLSSVNIGLERLDARAMVLNPSLWANRMEGTNTPRVVRINPPASPNLLQRQMVDLSPELVGGFGIVRLRSTSPELRNWQGRVEERASILQVTNLGVNVKLTPDGATVWVTQLSDGAPVDGADIVVARSGKNPWTGRTDASGLAVAQGDFYDDGESEWSGDPLLVLAEKGGDAAIVEASMTGPFETWEHGIYREFSPAGLDLRVEGFADRGVYRPGDPVYVAATARIASLQGLVSAPNLPVEWSLQDPEGTPVQEGKTTLSAMGNVSISTALPPDARIGDWRVVVEAGASGNAASGSAYIDVPVKAYRAPSFRVDVSGPARALSGGTLSASARAAYLFGTPMKGAKLKWSVRRVARDPQFDGFEDYSFSTQPVRDWWSPSESLEEPISSGTGVLDPNGQFAVTQALNAGDVAQPYTYVVESTVTDADRQQVSGRTTIAVDSSSIYAGLRADSAVAEAGKPLAISFIAVNAEGGAKAGTSVRIQAVRRTWDTVRERAMDGTWRWVSNAKEETVKSESVASTAQARTWTFVPETGGNYVIRAEVKDQQGRVATSETSAWVYGGDVSWARSDRNDLELVSDRKEYQPGDTARILVKGPKGGLNALVTVEREGIWTRKMVTLSSTAATIEIPITAEMVPNAFVSVVAAEGAPPATELGAGVPAAWYGVARLAVSGRDQRIDTRLSTDKETYQPGDSVTVSLDARRAGKALAGGHVVMWAVDYGVLSLTAYQTPELFSLFYAPRSLGVVTADNRASIYDRAARLAKGADVGGGGGAASSSLRSNFVTTPLWEGNLATGADGKLTHRFALPDNLTTFRVMAVVDDGAAAFGKAETELRVNRPLIARPALPRFFRGADRAFAGVVVHNNTATEAEVVVTATAEGATLHGAPRTVRVESNGALEVPFGITDFTRETVTFTFTATGGGNSDAVEWKVPMKAARPTEVVATAGSTQGTETVAIDLPKDVLRESGGLDVAVSASALVGIGKSIDYVVDYPHGCMEQTTSRLRVAMSALRVREQAGIATPVEKLNDIVGAGLSRMATFRTAGGGFAYWPGDPRPDALATAYAAEALAEARAGKHAFDPTLLDGAVRTLREVLAGRHMPAWYSEEHQAAVRARAALALARAGSADSAFTNRVATDLGQLPNFSKAQLLETLARTNRRDPRLAALLGDLESSLFVEATTAALVDKDSTKWQALWWGEDVGTIEFVRALLVAKPEHPLLPRLVAHVVRSRKAGRWSNTWSTAEALSALSEYSSRFESGAVNATVMRGTTQLLAENLGKGGQRAANVPMNLLDSSPLTFAATGGRLYYESRLSYARPTLPPRDEGFTVERKMEVLEGGGGTGRVEPGSLVRVTIRVVTPVDRYHVAVVDSLPAGLEPVDTSFTTEVSGLSEDTGSRGRDTGEVGPEAHWWSRWIFNRRELRDDEVIWYADYMPAGIHTESWIARATSPGNYAHPAASAYQMYAPDVYGRTEAGRFVVGSAVAKR